MRKFSEQKKINENKESFESLTIEEFSNLREAMYAVKTSESPSAYQAKEFFKNEDNFNAVVEKLRFLLTYGKDSTFQ